MTDRQKSVVALIRAGKTYKEAGAELGISGETVKAHVMRIAAKCGATSKPLRWVIANADKLLAA